MERESSAGSPERRDFFISYTGQERSIALSVGRGHPARCAVFPVAAKAT